MQLYNTLTRKKELFTPQTPNKVNMYVCGITAYDYCHLGHARSSIVFDVLVRYLRFIGNTVTFVRNFTDVDDKIIARANKEGLSSTEIAEKYIAAFHEDMDTLNVLRADIEPRATEYIGEMISLCEKLIAKEKAYATPSGDVYFRVRAFEQYGKLSGRDVDDLRSGARIAPGEEKEDPLDFALWKAAKPNEPSWESPWGQGRPGWHIECSAMSEKNIPLPLDIHGGGQDLIFPHHENEIAQSEAVIGKPLANYWVHNGFVQINTEKMSKSLNNFKTIRDVLTQYKPEVLRLFLLTRHYRSPIDFSFDSMDEAEKNVRRIYETLAQCHAAKTQSKWTPAALPKEIEEEILQLDTLFDASMDDDINTAAALGHILNLVRLCNRVFDDKQLKKTTGCQQFAEKMQQFAEKWQAILGILGANPETFLQELRLNGLQRLGMQLSDVEAVLAQRLEARQQKDFAKADALRDELLAKGVSINDTPAGQTWDIA